jgi:glutamate-1-semialdehyde 2,1-aminomutase
MDAPNPGLPLAPGAQDWHRFPVTHGVPVFFSAAKGSRLKDQSGHEVIDLYCGSGTVILGHANISQIERVRDIISNGATVSLRHPIELDVAHRLVRLTGTERVAFFKTGSEAVYAAVRVAARATGRTGVLGTGNHGWLSPLQALDPRQKTPEMIELQWDSPTLVKDAKQHIDSAACLVLSPLPVMPNPSVVRSLVEMARSRGALIIADEVKAGFRRAFPTVMKEIGIAPDLLVVSKALANGFPVAALCGRNDLLGDRDLFRVFSTYASEMVSLTAADACLELLEAGAYQAFRKSSSEMHDRLTRVASEYGGNVVGVPTFFRFELPTEIDEGDLCRSMYESGVLYHPLDEVLLSAAHTSEDIDISVRAFVKAIRQQLT